MHHHCSTGPVCPTQPSPSSNQRFSQTCSHSHTYDVEQHLFIFITHFSLRVFLCFRHIFRNRNITVLMRSRMSWALNNTRIWIDHRFHFFPSNTRSFVFKLPFPDVHLSFCALKLTQISLNTHVSQSLKIKNCNSVTILIVNSTWIQDTKSITYASPYTRVSLWIFHVNLNRALDTNC